MNEEDLIYEAFERYAICIEDGHLSEQEASRIVMKQFGTLILNKMKKKYVYK